MTILLLLLFGLLAMSLFGGDWRTGLLITIVIGFAQDPIRKLTPGQPSIYVGLVLIAFLATSFVLWQQRGCRLELIQMFRNVPALATCFTALVILVLLQAFNGLLLWDLPSRVAIGIGFYLAPLLGLWMGFQLGLNQYLLNTLLKLYLICTGFFAFTAFLDYRGLDIPLFQAVGSGQIIFFRYGYYTTGAIGLWRSTDIAAMHLAIGSCLSFVYAFIQFPGLRRILWLILSSLLALTSILTGRRKAVVQIVVFFILFALLIGVYDGRRNRPQFLASIFTLAAISSLGFFLDPSEFLGNDFSEYVDRAQSAPADLWDRFNILGLGAFLRGLEISNGFGIGVGTLAQTGAANIADVEGESFAYVSESGVGKVVAELGIPGLLLFLIIGWGLFLLIRRNFKMISLLPPRIAVLQTGLLSFALSNLPFFSSAAGVYGDPFILILCGLCFGSFFAVPNLVEQQRKLELMASSSAGK
jgi:hypothetical protein